MAAQPGTTTTIRAGATLELTGDGGFYRSSAAGQGALTNNGVLRKSGGTGTSVVDAAYSGSGQVVVQTGTLALPDGGLVGAVVSPGSALATGRCAGPSTGSTCQPTQDPTADPMSVNLTVPGANGSATAVQVQELGPVGAGVDPNGVGNEVLAHADNLVADTAHPATITLRYSQADVMGTPLDEVQVVHTTDDLQQVLLPELRQRRPAQRALELRASGRSRATSQNTFVTVLTTQTSRWRVRRSLPVANQGAPTAPRAVTVKEAKPFDGSVLNVSWTAPASSGAGAVAAYRVFVDGKLKASPAGTSATVKNAGPGKHTIKVAAVNAAGTSATGADTIKLAALSKPRKVEAERGKAGAPSTVTLEWKAPADAGGFTLKKYEVAIFKGEPQGGHREAERQEAQGGPHAGPGAVHLPGPGQEHRRGVRGASRATRSGRADSEQAAGLEREVVVGQGRRQLLGGGVDDVDAEGAQQVGRAAGGGRGPARPRRRRTPRRCPRGPRPAGRGRGP